MALLHATTLVAELGEFNRFKHPGQLMGYTGKRAGTEVAQLYLRALAASAVSALILGSFFITVPQLFIWKDSGVLFRHILSTLPEGSSFEGEVKLKLAKYLLETRQFEEGGRNLMPLVQASSRDPMALLLRAEYFLDTKQPDLAKKDAADLIMLNGSPDQSGRAFLVSGLAALMEKRPDEAVSKFKEAVRLIPRHDEACAQLALAYLLLGNREEARKYAGRALELDAGNETASSVMERLR